MKDEGFQHVSVGVNQMLDNLRKRMDENKAKQEKPAEKAK